MACFSPGNEIRICRIFGIEIAVYPSWFFIFLLVSAHASLNAFPILTPQEEALTYWLLGTSSTVCFFVSLLAHELAHSLVAKAFGLRVKNITLFMFGGVSNIEQEPTSPKAEFFIAIVGPIVSIALGLSFSVLSVMTLPGFPEILERIDEALMEMPPVSAWLLWLGMLNLLVGIFNLIPGFPLDGGRVVHSILWMIMRNYYRATRYAALVGQGIAGLLIFCGILMVTGIRVPFFGKGVVGGLWLVLIGWFLYRAASASFEAVEIEEGLGDSTVAQLARRNIPIVSPTEAMQDVVGRTLLGTDAHVFFVKNDGEVEGVLELEAVRIESLDLSRMVRDAMTPLSRDAAIQSDDLLVSAMRKMRSDSVDHLLVMHGDSVYGVLFLQDIMLWLSIRQKNQVS